jgi:hypothetical protein
MLRQALLHLGSSRVTAWCAVLLALLLGLAWLDPAPEATREHLAAWFVAAKVPFVFGGEGPIGRPLVLPLPGGLLLLVALAINLLTAAMAVAGPLWRTLPDRLVRAGAGLAAAAAAVSPHVVAAGELSLCLSPTDLVAAGDRQASASAFTARGTFELALLRDDGGAIAEWVVPASAWRGRPAVTLRAAALPFRVELHHPSEDCEVHRVEAAHPIGALVVGGAFLAARSRTAEGFPMPGAYVRVVPDAGTTTDGIVVGYDRSPASRYRAPFVFEVAGRRYGLDLRPSLHDLPFALELRELRGDPAASPTDPGGSRAVVALGTTAGERIVDVAPGEPLRQAGHTLALAGVGSVGGVAGEPATPAARFRIAADPTAVWWNLGLLVLSAGLLLGATQRLFGGPAAKVFAAKLGLFALAFGAAVAAPLLVPAVGRLDAATWLAAATASFAGLLAGFGLLAGWARKPPGAACRWLTDLAAASASAALLAAWFAAAWASSSAELSGLTGGAPPAVLPGLGAAACLLDGAGPARRWWWAALLLPLGVAAVFAGLLR